MMENLSNKIKQSQYFRNDCDVVIIEEVKEFIRLEFKLILMLYEKKISLDKFIDKRLELLGEKLK